MTDRRGTFVDRLLDGLARLDQLEAEVAAWAAGDRRRPLDQVLGLDASELELVASTPEALRYIVHARRFGVPLDLEELRGHRRVLAHATRLASRDADPFELADIEAWAARLDADARAGARQEPSHA